jgi:hypothetical protein
MRTFQAFLGAHADEWNSRINFLLFACLISGVTAWMFKMIVLRLETGATSTKVRSFSLPAKKQKWLAPFLILFSTIIVARAAWDAQATTYEWDELMAVAQIPSVGYWKAISLANWTTHPLALAVSDLSSQLFGSSRLAVRLPAVIFTAALTAVVSLLCYRFASPMTTVLVFFHLAANQTLNWYFHSIRGYVSAMASSLFLLFAFLMARENSPGKSKFWLISFGMCFGIPIFSHLFGGVFSVSLFFAILLWLFFDRERLSDEQIKRGLQLLTVCVPWIPVLGLIFLLQAREFSDYLKADTISFSVNDLLSLFAEPFLWVSKLVLIFYVFAIGFGGATKRPYSRFLVLFLATTFVLLVGLVQTMHIAFLQPRYFLPFFIPLLFVIGETIAGVPNPHLRRILFASLFLLMGVVPWRASSAINEAASSAHAKFSDFIKATEKMTAPIEQNCYQFSGNPIYAGFAERIHFRRSLPLASGACKSRYLLHFGLGPYDPIPLDPKFNALTPLYKDNEERMLYDIGSIR